MTPCIEEKSHLAGLASTFSIVCFSCNGKVQSRIITPQIYRHLSHACAHAYTIDMHKHMDVYVTGNVMEGCAMSFNVP